MNQQKDNSIWIHVKANKLIYFYLYLGTCLYANSYIVDKEKPLRKY